MSPVIRGGGTNPHPTPMRFRSDSSMRIAAGGKVDQGIKKDDQSRGIATTSEATIHPYLISLDERGRQITVPSRHTLQVRDPNALLDPAGSLRPVRTIAELKGENYEGMSCRTYSRNI
ncbi:hypothetical protein F4813DRAFT_361338 [Daldinia decipiens]|uniref:uncharacterized protein n=1 Tax=Daldinia decipiens TaxID=326647 RepID=UPI0020C26B6D|nr:uncharacterized protein F4813DRAFT_361338 [Daldinia decipiens]KAI1657026.1 hypothetical protein F4813DRAFT_361338 [Daldinia decipiens]